MEGERVAYRPWDAFVVLFSSQKYPIKTENVSDNYLLITHIKTFFISVVIMAGITGAAVVLCVIVIVTGAVCTQKYRLVNVY